MFVGGDGNSKKPRCISESDGVDPVIYAATNHRFDIVEALLTHGAKPTMLATVEVEEITDKREEHVEIHALPVSELAAKEGYSTDVKGLRDFLYDKFGVPMKWVHWDEAHPERGGGWEGGLEAGNQMAMRMNQQRQRWTWRGRQIVWRGPEKTSGAAIDKNEKAERAPIDPLLSVLLQLYAIYAKSSHWIDLAHACHT